MYQFHLAFCRGTDEVTVHPQVCGLFYVLFRIDVALEGQLGQKAIADKILVFGAEDTDEEALKDHDRNLREVFNRFRQKDIKLNPGKIPFRKKQVSYMGHIKSSEGLRVDLNKLKAINEMPPPVQAMSVCGLEINMLKLRGWSGLTNNYFKAERLEWAYK